MSEETYTRQVVLNGLQESSFTLDVEADEYDVTLTGWSSDKSINETSLIWADRTDPAYTENLRSITYAESLGLFAAVSITGTGNRIITSPDGITWTTRANPEDNSWTAITWSEQVGAFVAVSNTGTNRAMRSQDGIVWVTQTIASQSYQDVKYFPQLARFYAVSTNGGTGRAASSPDGITWTLLTTDTTTQWRGIAYSPTLGTGQGRLVAVGLNTSTNDRVMYSDDAGATWTISTSITSARTWNRVVWSPIVNRFVAVQVTTGSNIAYSDDGITWIITNAPDTIRASGLTWEDELNLYVATNLSTLAPFGAYTSTDGITWTGTNTLTNANNSYGVAYGAGKVVLLGDSGRIYTSYVGNEQKPLVIDFYDLNTGGSGKKTMVSNTARFEKPMIHFTRTRVGWTPMRYRITDASGLPINRAFTAVFELARAEDNILLKKARMHTRVIALDANEGFIEFDLDPATYKPSLWAYAFSDFSAPVFCRLKINALNMGSGQSPVLVAHPGYSYPDIKYVTEYIQRRTAYRIENLDGSPFDMTNQVLSLIVQFERYEPAEFLKI